MIFVMNSNGFIHSFTKYFIKWHTWESWGRSVLSWVCSTLRLILSSETTGRPVLSEELTPSLTELTLISWERDVFLPSCMSSSRPDLSRFRLGVGWVGWKNFACRATFPSGCRATSPFGRRTTFEPDSLVHSCFSEIFGRSRSDMHTFSFKTSPVFTLTTFGIHWAGSDPWRMIAFDRAW